MFGAIGIIGSRPADLDAALVEIERLNEIIVLQAEVLAHLRRCQPLTDGSPTPIPEAPVQTTGNAPSSQAAATASGMPVCVSLPSDDLAIPPLPFNALRWST